MGKMYCWTWSEYQAKRSLAPTALLDSVTQGPPPPARLWLGVEPDGSTGRSSDTRTSCGARGGVEQRLSGRTVLRTPNGMNRLPAWRA